AGLGGDVIDDLQAFDPSTVTVREQIWLALGLLASGDETDARTLERSILAASGQRLDPWVRLNTGTTREDGLDATALMLVLAGQLGDPLAAGLRRYVADQPSTEAIYPLQLLGYVRGSLDRLSRSAGQFVWTLAGVRHEETLEPGGAFSLPVTATQLAELHIDRTAGDLVVSSAWLGDATSAELPTTPGIRIVRNLASSTAPADGVFRVRLQVTIATSLPYGCYTVTELLPSGLAPLIGTPGWPDDETLRNLDQPWEVDGQRVSWCLGVDAEHHTFNLGYAARVVSPGTYTWEPAVVQSSTAVSLGSATVASPFTIR
ncbi:MAG TPA: hypothetical protein VNH13_04665, partial [Candidatus Acidoferrales bacterium]|nr:hypothetical protein [Candidatus Acidoferrales bacterium]